MQHFWIIGGGKFGLKAAEELCVAAIHDVVYVLSQHSGERRLAQHFEKGFV